MNVLILSNSTIIGTLNQLYIISLHLLFIQHLFHIYLFHINILADFERHLMTTIKAKQILSIIAKLFKWFFVCHFKVFECKIMLCVIESIVLGNNLVV